MLTLIYIVCALLLNSFAQAQNWDLLPTQSDTPSAHYSSAGRIVAVGDVHADDISLISILRQTNFIDQDLHWIGGDATLVLMGDLLDRGFNSRRVMDLLMKLEIEAAKTGGRVICLLGNHELMVTQGELEFFNTDDAIKNYGLKFSYTRPEWKRDVLAFFHRDSPYARWIAGRPSVVLINRTLFVHAGFERWLPHVDLDRVNATIRAWLLYYQRNGKAPPIGTAWTIGQQGPLWTRQLAQGAVPADAFVAWLDQLGIDRVVVGHTTVDTSYLARSNRTYGDRLRMIDTGISKFIPGSLSALEIGLDGGVTPKFLRDADCFAALTP